MSWFVLVVLGSGCLLGWDRCSGTEAPPPAASGAVERERAEDTGAPPAKRAAPVEREAEDDPIDDEVDDWDEEPTPDYE